MEDATLPVPGTNFYWSPALVKWDERRGPVPASNPTGSKSLPANRAASKNRFARAERALSAACAAALNCSATCHFFVLTLRLPFITALEVNHKRLLPTGIEA